MTILKLFTLTLFCFYSSTIFAQQNGNDGTLLNYSLTSHEGKEYQINVTLPPNFNAKKTYPSLFYLDAYWLSQTINGAFTILNLSHQIDDVVLVGISLKGSIKDWNIQRSLDYTPSVFNAKLMGFQMISGIGDEGVNLDETNSGKAALFLTFLEDSVLKMMKTKYPNVNLNRTLLGHSFGGLFTFYALQQKPHLFKNYISISPSLWWNKQELNHPELFKKFIAKAKSKKIFFVYGGAESGLIVKSNQAMDSILKTLELNTLDYQFVNYPKANHHSLLPQAIYDGMLFIFGKE